MRVYFITIPIPLLITKYNIDKKKKNSAYIVLAQFNNVRRDNSKYKILVSCGRVEMLLVIHLIFF